MNHLILISEIMYAVKKDILGLPRYNEFFGYFTAISLYRESRCNNSSIWRYNFTAPLAYRKIGCEPLNKKLFFLAEYYRGAFKGAMSPHTHARATENKLEKVGPSFSSSVGDFGRLFLSV